MTDPFARFGALMYRRRWLVIGAWIVIAVVAGGMFAPKAATTLKAGGYILPGSESDDAEHVLRSEFNASTASNVEIVFHSPDKPVDDPALTAELTAALGRVAKLEGVSSVTSFFTTGDPTLLSADHQTTVAIVGLEGTESEVQELVGPLREQLADVSIEHDVTGTPAVNYDISKVSEKDLRRSEVFTIPIVLILLLIVFRTVVAAAIPLALGAVSVVTALAVIYGIATQTDTSIFALNVASMIGLGLGIDFSLILVSRFREELARGLSTEDAVALTMATAGRSITFSGITVVLGMLVLTALFGLMIVRSISLGVMLVAICALAAGLTLLPAVLAALGPRIDVLRVIPQRKATAAGTGVWYRLSHAIMRRPWIWLAVSLGVLILIAAPARELKLYGSTSRILPNSVESAAGVETLNDAFGANSLTPVQIVIQTGEQNGAWQPAFLTALRQLSDTLAADDRVATVLSLSTLASDVPPEQFATLTPDVFKADPERAAAAARFVNLNGANDTAVLTVISKFDQYDPRHEQLVYDLRNTILPGVAPLQGDTISVGGDAARFLDFKDFLYGRFPYLIAAVMALTFVILMMFFQSVFLPLKAILMNLASIIATYGVLVLIFDQGHGASLLGFDAIGQVGAFTPAVLFAILFGMSTDYEVFMLSRVKEYYHESGNNEEAVAAGLEHTAGVITAAGLILIGTFGSFGIADVVTVKEIGLGLAIGVLLDSTIVRIVMVPATMRLAGNLNWYMPDWLRKIVPEIREGPAPASASAPRQPEPAFAPEAPVAAPALDGGLLAGSRLALATADAGSASAPSAQSSRLPAGRPARTQRPAPRMVAWLRPTGGSVGVDQIRLSRRTPFRVGRDESSELQLFDPRISRHHARIEYRDGAYTLIDLNSTNGVYVNGQRADGATVLRSGDKLEFGNMGTVTFDFELTPA